MPDKVLYTAEVISTGDGRNGHVLSSDHRLDLDLSVPPELDGPGGHGTNPEQLFAAGVRGLLPQRAAGPGPPGGRGRQASRP